MATPEGYHLYFGRPMVCFNALHLNEALARIPSGASAVYLHVTDLVTLIDHTTTTTLLEFVEDFKRTGRGIAEILGLDRLRPRSHAHSCMRVSPPVLAKERAEALRAMARVSLSRVDAGTAHVTLDLVHMSLSVPERSATHSDDHPITGLLTRACGLGVGTSRRLFAFVVHVFRKSEATAPEPLCDLDWYSLTLPKTADPKPGDSMAYLSLTTPAQPPHMHSQAYRPDVRLI